MPAVSVAMPVFNGTRFMREAIESILAQSFDDLELIISDDGSTDGSRDIAAAYAGKDPRVRLIVSEHGGIAAAMNRALAVARGRYFAPMDQDDVASPDRLARSIEFLEANPGVALVGGMVRVIDEVGNARGKKTRPLLPGDVAAAMHRCMAVVHPASMLRTNAARMVGGYRSILPFAEDYDLFLRLMERHDVANIPDIVLAKRKHAGQVTGDRSQRAPQAITKAIVYLSYLSRQTCGRDMLSDGGTIVAAAQRFVESYLSRRETPSPAALYNIARFARYAPFPMDGSRSAHQLYASLVQKTIQVGRAGDAARTIWYLVSYFAANRRQQHDRLASFSERSAAAIGKLVDVA